MPLPSPVDLLFPPKCPICRKLVGLKESICPDCARALPYASGGKVKQKGDFIEGCYSPFFYEEPLRGSFLRYKFNGKQHYARCYGKWMADCLMAQDQTDFDLVTWAPLSRLRRWRRGYDQAELLARRVGELSGLPAVPTLEKIRHTVAQSRIEDDSARLANVQGAYRLLPGVDLPGQTVVLVDDVVTTGATLSQCAALLRQAGAARVVALTLARSRK